MSFRFCVLKVELVWRVLDSDIALAHVHVCVSVEEMGIGNPGQEQSSLMISNVAAQSAQALLLNLCAQKH